MPPLVLRAIAYTILLAAPLVMIRAFQDRLLYFAEALPQADYLRAAAAAQLAPWPASGELRGLVRDAQTKSGDAPGPATDERGTVAVLHGNAGFAFHRDFYADALAPLGYRVVLLEYPMYGPRQGRLGEEALVADARESLRLLRSDSPGPLLLVGESLGAGVAAAVAKATPENIDALLLITPWDTLASVAAHHYPWLPVRLLLVDRYDNIANLHDFTKPIAVVIAERDEIIPPRFAETLIGRLGPNARRIVIAETHHNNWADRLAPDWWLQETERLLGPLRVDSPGKPSGLPAR